MTQPFSSWIYSFVSSYCIKESLSDALSSTIEGDPRFIRLSKENKVERDLEQFQVHKKVEMK